MVEHRDLKRIKLDEENMISIEFENKMLIDEPLRIIKTTQIFYIATSKFYAKQNIFKIGGTEDYKKLDDFYYLAVFHCHDYKLVEHFISSILSDFRTSNKKDLYHISFDILFRFVSNFINNLEDHVRDYNCNYQFFLDTLSDVREYEENNKIRNLQRGVWLGFEDLYFRN